MSSDRGLQSFCRRKYSPLFSFQKRLRHVRGVCFRNLRLPSECSFLRVELRNSQGAAVVAEGESLTPQSDISWLKLDIRSSYASKDVLVVLLADNRPVLEWTVHLSGLVFVSRHLPDSSVTFCSDSLLLILAEGIYCDKSCFATPDHGNLSQQQLLSSPNQPRRMGPTPSNDPGEVVNENAFLSATEISPQIAQTVSRKNNPGDPVALHNQRLKVFVKAAALCDVREKISVDPRRLRKSYGVNALNRLSTMERAIRHTTATARTLQASLEGSLSNRIGSLAYKVRCDLETIRLRCRALEYYVKERESLLNVEKKQLIRDEEMVDSIKTKVDEYHFLVIRDREGLRNIRENLQKSKFELANVGLVERQVALICELDEYIYPIMQVPDGSGYTICSVLVQSLDELKDHKRRADDQMISTGMAYVFHLVCMLSIFTGVPLIYPLKYDRNTPVIVDVSIDAFHQKEFPLWVKGKDRLYFEHAVPLLARNVAHLRVHFGLPSMRGRMMAGLYGLLNFFKKKRLTGVSCVSDLSGASSVVLSEPTVSDSNVSSRCVTPGSSPHATSPHQSPRLKHRVHSSVPNLISTPVESIFADVDKGAASDSIS